MEYHLQLSLSAKLPGVLASPFFVEQNIKHTFHSNNHLKKKYIHASHFIVPNTAPKICSAHSC